MAGWKMMRLSLGRFILDHAGPSDFGAGAGGGRHGDDRQHLRRIGAPEIVTDVFEVPQRPVLEGCEGDCLAGVQSAAAAERNHPVGAMSPEGFTAVGDVSAGRIAGNVAESGEVETSGGHGRPGLGDHRADGQAPVGDQERSLDADRSAGLGQLGDAAGAEPNGGRVVPITGERSHGGRW